MSDDVVGQIVAGFAGGVLVLVAQWGARRFADWRDANRIYKWLLAESKAAGTDKFRSTRAIASHANLTEQRAYELCAEDPRIMLSTGRKEGMWSIELRQPRKVSFQRRRG